MARVILFDIDGTLVRTGGAGSRAMGRAFTDLFGVAGPFDSISMAGRTDRSIFEEALERTGVAFDDGLLQRFRTRYCERLEEALPEPGHPKGVMAGVRPLLEALACRPGVFVALLTGNYERGAQIKLKHFDLWHYFPCGAFGDDARDRIELFPLAMARARACGAPAVSPAEVMVVGDTVLDVGCAAAAGARSVAVATGPVNVETLKRSGADVVFEDLRDTTAFLDLL